MVSIKRLKEAIMKSWGEDTCHYKFLWRDKSLPDSAGHCRVVSLIVQDYLGGSILYSHVKGNMNWDHYWNLLPSGKELDLTKDQFSKNIKLVKSKKVSRKEVLSSKRTTRGYELLKNRVKNYCSKE